MKRLSIWVVGIIIAFTWSSMAVASEQAYHQDEGDLEPTELSSKALQEPYAQALASASANQNGYTISVIPDSLGFPDILLTVSIRDADGYFIGGLTADDISVFEQSTTESAAVSQELTCFHETVSGDSANSFAIAIDVSGSMGLLHGGELEEAKSLAEEFIENTLETDRASLISFSNGGTEEIVLSVNEVTADSDGNGTVDIVEAINGLETSNRTALFDGTALAIESLAQESDPKAVIVFSDGKTNDDLSYDINSLIEKATNEGIMIFAIVLDESSATMEAIATLTGGKCYYASTELDMAEIYYDIAGIIQTEFTYTLCYTTHNTAMDGTTRTVTVQYDSGEGTGFYTVNFAPVIARDEATQQLGNQSQTQGVALTISGNITDTDAATDPEQALNARLYYRRIGTTTYANLSLALVEGENGVYSFSQDIPGGQVLEPGIEYYLYASDQISTVFAPVLYETQPYVIGVFVSEPPTADAGGDMAVEERNLVTLDGTGSTDPDQILGDVLTYEWAQTEGVSVELTNALEPQAEFFAPQVGPEGSSLTFMLTVTDIGGLASTDTVTISITDSTPEAAFSWSPNAQTAGESVAFTDMSTTSGDAIVGREWDFGGEGTGTGEAPSYTFERSGTYSVTLTVTDSDGSTDTVTHSITIESCPNGNCDPGGGCFISESTPKKGDGGSGILLPFVVLFLLFSGFVAATIHVLRNRFAHGRKNRICFAMLMSIILFTVSPNVHADVQKGAFTLSPMIGGYMFDSKQDIEEGPVYGLGLGYNITENWGFRLYGHYGEFNHPYWECETCRCVEEDIDVSIFQVNLVYHLWPDSRFVPYLAAGAGYVNMDADNTGSDSSGTLNYGGGIKYFLTQNLALKANIRHLYRIDDSRSNMMANVGLEFQFGGPKEKLVQEPEKAVAPVDKPPETEEEVPAPVVPEPMEEEIPLIEKPEPEILVLRIKFAFDSAKVEPVYHNVIEQAVQFLNEHPAVDAMIEGHTCSIGTETYNMGLSRRRAESVKTYMVENFNMDAARLSTAGYGESRPDHDNSTLEGKQLNRRVVIRLEEE